MKKVVGIIGSLRKDSIHRIIFKEYQNLSHSHFELIEGAIDQIPMFNPDLEKTPESVLQLSDLILEADGVIFFSPEYNYSVPGVLKNAIDWISRDSRLPFSNKAAAIVGASPGLLGTARMQYHLRQIGVFLNLQFLNKPEVMIGQAFDKVKDGKLLDDQTKSFLEQQIAVLASKL